MTGNGVGGDCKRSELKLLCVRYWLATLDWFGIGCIGFRFCFFADAIQFEDVIPMGVS